MSSFRWILGHETKVIRLADVELFTNYACNLQLILVCGAI
jgi:hypothetical protein